MKEFIYINYNLIVDKIYNECFFIGNEKIKIIKYKDNIEKIDKLVKISNELYYKNIMVDTFIVNKHGKYYTQRKNEYVILLKVNDRDKLIDLEYLNQFSLSNNLDKENIVLEWKQQIDDFESKILKYNKENILIQKTSNYFIGLAENAVSLINEYINYSEENIGHKINFNSFTKEELNNPLTFIKIDKMYDISNYIKIKFFENKLNYIELEEIIKETKNEQEEVLLFAYLLYPNYYFDQIDNSDKESKIKKIIKLIKKYEKMLLFYKENSKKCKKIKLFVWLN